MHIDDISKKKRDKEKVLIAVVDFKGVKKSWGPQETLREMQELVIACRGQVVDSIICKVEKPTPRHLIGKGNLEDIKGVCSIKKVDTVIFSHDLKGSQQRNLEDEIKVKTIDRTQLILDIFARRAQSKEGKMQIELAQLEYLLPRLTGKGVELSRLGGGIGTLGPGETKLEVDRRRISQRIAKLKKGLKEVESNRTLKRKKRKDQGVPTLSLVGYTNAGKSTLLNALTEANQVTKDGLFTTLDSLTRQLVLPNNQKVILSDTVGFMHELPHNLIESFKATLEEVTESDILLHVVDISRENFRLYHDSVQQVLQEISAADKPTITILNKIDGLEDRSFFADLKNSFENVVMLSAKTKENMSELIDTIKRMLSSLVCEINVYVPVNRMDLVNLAHEKGEVFSIKYYPDSINIRASVPLQVVGKFQK